MKTGKYVVLDVEKANNDHASVCQIGLIVLENGVASGEFLSFVNPQSDFLEFHTRIHGIHAHHVQDAPTMAQLKGQLSEYLRDATVCSYGTSDKHALACFFDTSSMSWLDISTVVRHSLPEFKKGGHKLVKVAEYLGIPFNPNEAHNALADAKVASEVLLRCLDRNPVNIERFVSKPKTESFSLF